MATVNETPKPFDDQLRTAWIKVDLREERDEEGDLLPKLDRLYFEKPTLKSRDDGLELKYPNLTLKIDDSLDTFEAGDTAKLGALLLKLWTATENVE